MDRTELKSKQKCISENCKNIGILTRTPASNGLWLTPMLTISLAVNVWFRRNQQTVHLDYKRTTILCFGLLVHSAVVFLSLARRTPPGFLNKISTIVLSIFSTGFLFWVCLNENIIFSFISASLGIILYNGLLFRVLKHLPRSFTLGEATVVCQGTVLFLYNAFLQLPRIVIHDQNRIKFDRIFNVLEVILLGVLLIVVLPHFFYFFRRSYVFWFVALTISICCALFPIYGESIIIILIKFMLSDTQRLMIIAVYCAMLCLTSVFVCWQINRNSQTNTVTRKMFHILMLMVYLPGLWYQCKLLFVASILMLSLLVVLETARVIQLKPFHEALNRTIHCFIDDKDCGVVALTHIYLLVGCSIPLWLHPDPCDITDSAGINLLKLSSGLLSVGIGDTMASFIGYYFGKHPWPGTKKSVEGTLASVISQFAAVYALYWLNYLNLNTLKSATVGCAIIINALVEAKTNQVDNLVLPIVTYIILATV
ncbi:dolichol kinase [Uranotaenia lowii]|uniref:dolichol kinase n=1 Tax=Uranotaenia lowii TaxID=190385 RepID=UPI00247AFBA5|nr:dolichol kinase [Uranotaenia lowii]